MQVDMHLFGHKLMYHTVILFLYIEKLGEMILDLFHINGGSHLFCKYPEHSYCCIDNLF